MEKKAKKGTKVSSDMANSKFHMLFVDGIKDIYWAEKNLVKALPKMKNAATSSQLQEAIESHLEETKGHVSRLEEVFELLDLKPEAKKCEAMAGLIKEANELVEETEDDTMVRDCAIILAAQKVEHYEIATYGSLREWAKKMDHQDIADLLEETLQEEKNADEKLTEIAESDINDEGAAE